MKALAVLLFLAMASQAFAEEEAVGPIYWSCKRKLLGRPVRTAFVSAFFLTTGLGEELICAKIGEKRRHCMRELLGTFQVSENAPGCR